MYVPSALSTSVEIEVSAMVVVVPLASVKSYVPSPLSTSATVPAASLISSIASCTFVATSPEVVLS